MRDRLSLPQVRKRLVAPRPCFLKPYKHARRTCTNAATGKTREVGANSCATSMFRAFLESPNEQPDTTYMSGVGEPLFE